MSDVGDQLVPWELRNPDEYNFRAFTADELRRIATTVDEMPAPRGQQPREVQLAVRHPLQHVDETFGALIWSNRELRWLFIPGPSQTADPDVRPWTPGAGQTAPSSMVTRRDRGES